MKINQRYHLVFSAHLATEPSPVVRLLLHQLSVAFCRHLVVVVVLILLVVDGFYVVVIILVVLDSFVFINHMTGKLREASPVNIILSFGYCPN